MDSSLKARIGENKRLQEVTQEIANLLDGAERDAFFAALANNDAEALAKALHVSTKDLDQIAQKVYGAATELADIPELALAAHILSD